jgi:hypothetical protein
MKASARRGRGLDRVTLRPPDCTLAFTLALMLYSDFAENRLTSGRTLIWILVGGVCEGFDVSLRQHPSIRNMAQFPRMWLARDPLQAYGGPSQHSAADKMLSPVCPIADPSKLLLRLAQFLRTFPVLTGLRVPRISWPCQCTNSALTTSIELLLTCDLSDFVSLVILLLSSSS